MIADASRARSRSDCRPVLKPPGGEGATVGNLAAVCAGADSKVEMLAELGMCSLIRVIA